MSQQRHFLLPTRPFTTPTRGARSSLGGTHWGPALFLSRWGDGTSCLAIALAPLSLLPLGPRQGPMSLGGALFFSRGGRVTARALSPGDPGGPTSPLSPFGPGGPWCPGGTETPVPVIEYVRETCPPEPNLNCRQQVGGHCVHSHPRLGPLRAGGAGSAESWSTQHHVKGRPPQLSGAPGPSPGNPRGPAGPDSTNACKERAKGGH